MSEAERRYAEDHRAGALKEQLKRWRLARELDAYLTELRSAASALSEEDGGDAETWIAWVEQYRMKIDPTGARIVTPKTPKPRSDDLGAYLPQGMNPYGPTDGDARAEAPASTVVSGPGMLEVQPGVSQGRRSRSPR